MSLMVNENGVEKRKPQQIQAVNPSERENSCSFGFGHVFQVFESKIPSHNIEGEMIQIGWQVTDISFVNLTPGSIVKLGRARLALFSHGLILNKTRRRGIVSEGERGKVALFLRQFLV